MPKSLYSVKEIKEVRLKKRNYNSIDWHKYLIEDINSPTGVLWKINRGTKMKAGSIAGSIIHYPKNEFSRVEIGLDNTNWFLHRILWVMRNGSINDELVIDHIDGNCLNNSKENLRVVERAVNQRNLKMSKTNTSGKTGVTIYLNSSGQTRVAAHWSDEIGKRKCKSFGVNRFGLLPAFAMACKYRENRIAELNNSGLGYTERHGCKIEH